MPDNIPYRSSWFKVVAKPAPYPTDPVKVHTLVDMDPGVGVVVFDGEVLYFADEYKDIANKRYLTLFCGALEPAEDPLVGAQRELLEEAGISAQQWTNLGSNEPVVGRVHGTQYLFLAQGLHFEQAHPEAGEDIKVVKIPLDRAIAMVMADEIRDARTCIGILKAAKYLGKNV